MLLQNVNVKTVYWNVKWSEKTQIRSIVYCVAQVLTILTVPLFSFFFKSFCDNSANTWLCKQMYNADSDLNLTPSEQQGNCIEVHTVGVEMHWIIIETLKDNFSETF